MATPAPADKNRRLSRRRPPKGGVRVACHRGGLYLGPDLALSVLDLSETGARLVLREALPAGREVSLLLEGRSNIRPIRRVADVAWSLPMADGGHCIGVRFQKHLTYRDLSELGRERSEPSRAGPPTPQPDQKPGRTEGSQAAASAGPTAAADRRRSERRPAERLLRCHVSVCEKEGPDFPATVLDVSCTGAGLLAPHRLAPGAAVVLRFAASGRRAGRSILARLAYAGELAAEGFLLGVEFLVPLAEVECRAILSPWGKAAGGQGTGDLATLQSSGGAGEEDAAEPQGTTRLVRLNGREGSSERLPAPLR